MDSNHPDEREPPLSEDERRALRHMIERDRRAAWLWSTIRVWVTWGAAVGIGLTVMWDTLRRIAKAAIE